MNITIIFMNTINYECLGPDHEIGGNFVSIEIGWIPVNALGIRSIGCATQHVTVRSNEKFGSDRVHERMAGRSSYANEGI